jgi:arachidonate 15-lipoxygenase
MLRTQVRAAVSVAAKNVHQRSPAWLRRGAIDRRLHRFFETIEAHAPGRIPSGGDAEFAYLRFAGTNPLGIARVRSLEEIPEKLRLSDALTGRLLGAGSTLADRVSRGNVFLLRHEALSGSAAADLQPGRFVAPVSALFCYAPEMSATYAVVPLAIECSVGAADGATGVFTPLDEARWLHAKRLAAVADVNASELVVHLARAHFMTVPFAIALRRTLRRSHPLRAFLLPHLRFNLFVERMAWLQGVRKPQGDLVRSLAGTPAWCQQVAKTLHRELSFRDQHFERDLEARGLNDHPVDYPYRDDGRLLWAALRNFTEGYVGQNYPDDGAVLADAALQRFMAEVRSPKGGNVRGLLGGERLETRAELVEILTQVLFVAGPLHALAHYASAAQLVNVGENPSWLTANPLTSTADAAPGELGGVAQYHRVVSTNIRYDRLGDFSWYPMGLRQESLPLVAELRAELEAAERIITERNLSRPAPFIHFLPSRIPNGITV